MRFIKFIEDKFWIPVSLSALIALFWPIDSKNSGFFIICIIMLNFFLSSLKIDLIDIIKHIKKPLFLTYILIIYLILIPVIVYYLFNFINPEIAIAMLLLASMPPAVVSPVLTDIFKGNISLSLTVALIAYLVSPFTIPLLFLVLTQKIITLDLAGLFQILLIISFIPLTAAQIIRKINKSLVEKTQKYYSFIAICSICLVTYLAISPQAKTILQNPVSALVDLLWLYVLFIVLFFMSIFIAFWRNKNDKTAIIVTKTFMNNSLTIGLAAVFFTPKIVFLMVLSEIPWNTTLGPFKYLLKYLK